MDWFILLARQDKLLLRFILKQLKHNQLQKLDQDFKFLI